MRQAIEGVIAELEGMFADYEQCLEMSAQDAYADAIFKLKEVLNNATSDPGTTRSSGTNDPTEQV